MFIRWDTENQIAIGEPSLEVGEEADWLELHIPSPRQSRAQTISYSLANGIVVGEWIGSSDPKDAPAQIETIRAFREHILQLPVTTDDGKTFQFDSKSRELIEDAIVALEATQGTIHWRLEDNTTVEVDSATLQTYYYQLVLNRAVRGLTIDAEYVALKTTGASFRDLENWKDSHRP